MSLRSWVRTHKPTSVIIGATALLALVLPDPFSVSWFAVLATVFTVLTLLVLGGLSLYHRFTGSRT